MKRVAILGSTGSIGRSALAVVDAHPTAPQGGVAGGGRERRAAGRAGRSATGPRSWRWRPAKASIGSRPPAGRTCPPVGTGAEGLIAVATHPSVDIVICASAGTAGLEAVLAAIEAGKTIALANKEVLVMAGELVTEAARRRGVAILPVDSEHNAIHQCLHARPRERGPAHHPDRVGRSVPRLSGRGARTRRAGGGAAASDLADGAEDHHRLGDADEQGARSHRGALAVRRRRRSDRRRHSSAVDRALDGGADRRLGDRAARRDRHAAADSVRVLVPGALGRIAAVARPGARRAARISRTCARSLSLPRPGVPRAAGRRHAAGGAERRQRNCGWRLSRSQARLYGDSARHTESHGGARRRAGINPAGGAAGRRLGARIRPRCGPRVRIDV